MEFIVKEEIPPSDTQARYQHAYGGDSMGDSGVSVVQASVLYRLCGADNFGRIWSAGRQRESPHTK